MTKDYVKNISDGELNTLEQQLLDEYGFALDMLEHDGWNERLGGALFAYESLLTLLEKRDDKKYITREESIFY